MQLKLLADCWQIAKVFSLTFQETLTYCKHSGLCMIIIERVLYILVCVFFMFVTHRNSYGVNERVSLSWPESLLEM